MDQPPPPGDRIPAAAPSPGYYCRHCGGWVNHAAVVCVTCGCQPWSGTARCWFCSAGTYPQAHVCVGCGASLVRAQPAGVGVRTATPSYTFMTTPPNGTVGTRSAIAAGVLGILLGGLGVHRFYLGYVGAGFAILCSVFFGILLSFLILPGLLAFAAGILALVEGILLLTGSFDTDATGARLQR